MSAFVYCLYSTEDGQPRYVGRTTDKVSYRYRQHVTAALEKEPGQLYDWMRDVWRAGYDVNVFTLQEQIVPADLPMFEQYWIGQFPGLLNVHGNGKGCKPGGKVAQQVLDAIAAVMSVAREERSPGRPA